MNAYRKCAPLSGIIQRKVKAFLNGKISFVDANGKPVSNIKAKKLSALINRPNPIQTWEQLIAEAYTFYSIFGEVFLFAINPIGFEGKQNISSLWVIPNWIISRTDTGKVYFQNKIEDIVSEYCITSGGQSVPVNVNQILHIRDTIVNRDNPIRGESKLVSLQDPVSNIIAAYEARNVLITKRGGIGILSNTSKDAAGAIPLKTNEKDDLQKEFRKYGMAKDQYQVIITSASLQWQSMTYPTKELMLFEEIEDDVRQIADNYDYPMYLLGFKDGTTYSNVREAKASLYQDSIIPESEAFYSALSTFFETERDGFSIKICYDHLEILQKSEKEKAESFKLMSEGAKIAYEGKVITKEEFRVLIGFDATTINGSTYYDGKATNTITVQ